MCKNKYSAILLTGGRSRRMGMDKALLQYKGISFLDVQLSKLRRAGIEDIIVSGTAAGMTADERPGCGPMGGIFTCLKLIKNSSALVLPIDTPLLSDALIEALLDAHRGDVTVLRHGAELEPLIGVYSRSVLKALDELINAGQYSLRKLFPIVECNYFDYDGDPTQLKNFNTPEDYKELRQS